MMIYGKDNTSAGLRELDEIIAAIRDGSFYPDNARALMFPRRPAANAEASSGRVVEQPDCDTDSSSEDSADEDMPDHEQLSGQTSTLLVDGMVESTWKHCLHVPCIIVTTCPELSTCKKMSQVSNLCVAGTLVPHMSILGPDLKRCFQFVNSASQDLHFDDMNCQKLKV